MLDAIISQLSDYITTTMLKQPGRVLRPEEALISSGLIDSFHLVDLALYVEEAFGARLDDTELTAETFDNLNQLAALVQSRIT